MNLVDGSYMVEVLIISLYSIILHLYTCSPYVDAPQSHSISRMLTLDHFFQPGLYSQHPMTPESLEMAESAEQSALGSLRAGVGSGSRDSQPSRIHQFDPIRSSMPPSSLRSQRLEHFFTHSFNVTDHLNSQSGTVPDQQDIRDALGTTEIHSGKFAKESADSGIGTSIHSDGEDSATSPRVPHRISGVRDGEFILYAVVRWYRRWIWEWAVPQNTSHGYDNLEDHTGKEYTLQNQADNKSSNKKRKHDDDQEKQGKDNAPTESTGASYISRQDRARKLRLACPFLKRHPMEYFQHQPCLLHWPNTARLKDH
ncbi:hypothetical protein GGR57DRAFT_475802 [Xylariaceae sp. FL1272]|nr:hypothetical protein GGR57DRAFT_475802 [Xylariaceae sp. FL1272]